MSLTLPLLLEQIAATHADHSAQMTKDADGVFQSRTWQEFLIEVDRFAAGLVTCGVARGSHVGLISENRAEWFVADMAILSLGAADVPRGTDATPGELGFILDFGDVQTTIVETTSQIDTLARTADRLGRLSTIICFDLPGEFSLPAELAHATLLSYQDVVARGAPLIAEDADRIHREREAGDADDVATLIFTSGTTGDPKGVMLTHQNFLHQVEHVPSLIDVGAADIWLCVLPVWHSFERIMQYVAMGRASALAYSKPIGRIMLEDFQKVRPTWMASVPRIWEAIREGIYRNVKKQSAVSQALFSFFVSIGGTWAHFRNMLTGRLPRFRRRIRAVDSLVALVPFLLLTPLKLLGNVLVFRKIQARLGGRFKAGISGGGALPSVVDQFFSAAGILLLEGYGLTETAPVLGVRAQHHPVPGTVGPVFPGTEIEIRSDDGTLLPPGTQGVVWARGPQIMKGYYKRDDLTSAIMKDGWINTGDLGMLTWDNELKITGRAKDTVVLRGGENVEPAPIEERLRESPYIAQAMIVGQDQKFLAALIVPDFDALSEWASANGVTTTDRAELATKDQVVRFMRQEIDGLVSAGTGFKSFERVSRFALLTADFQVGDELSAKQEIKRHVIAERYRETITALFS